MLPIALWAAPGVPGSRHPDAQHRIISRWIDTLDAGLQPGIKTSRSSAKFCRCLG